MDDAHCKFTLNFKGTHKHLKRALRAQSRFPPAGGAKPPLLAREPLPRDDLGVGVRRGDDHLKPRVHIWVTVRIDKTEIYSFQGGAGGLLPGLG